MDSATRSQYLQAMGITQWRRRDVGPEPTIDTESVVSVADTKAEVKVLYEDVSQQRNNLEDALDRAIAEPTPEILEKATALPPTNSPLPFPLASATASVSQLGWPELEAQVKSCRACSLCEDRGQAVFAVGPIDADLLVIGEAPNAEEDKQGLPFVGPAGQLLDAMLKAINYARAPQSGQRGAYITNIVKCRPLDDRDPQADEAVACRTYLDRQITLLQPKLILAVGGVAAKSLLDSNEKVGDMRGKLHHYGVAKIPLLVTYHPTYLLHSPSEKRKAWDDLKQARSLLTAE